VKTRVKLVLKAIEDINCDMSVPDTQTLLELEDIQDDLEGKIEALREQIKNRERAADAHR